MEPGTSDIDAYEKWVRRAMDGQRAEIKRLEYWVDQAFHQVCGKDPVARQILTNARWGKEPPGA